MLETIIFKVIRSRTTIESDKHKVYYWLGKTTNNKIIFAPMRPAIYNHQTVNHSKEFKAEDGTHTNKVEGQNSLLKGKQKHIELFILNIYV